jgi:hypothetical protein
MYLFMNRRAPLAIRFWKKVSIDEPDKCWLWTGSGSKSGGYGKITNNQKNQRPMNAHVASYELHYGPVPKGMEVCHACDVKLCVNPQHLWVGTHTDNMRDAKQKGRMRGPKRITPEIQDAIRASSGRYREIAFRFGVSAGTVSLIKNNNFPQGRKQPNKGRPPKFTKEQLDQIRAATGRQKEIALQFRTTQTSISRIKRGIVTKFVEIAA